MELFLRNAGEWAEWDCKANFPINSFAENRKKIQFKVLDKPLLALSHFIDSIEQFFVQAFLLGKAFLQCIVKHLIKTIIAYP